MRYHEESTKSSGLDVSICIPPLCGGAPVTGSVSLSQQAIQHHYQSATGQSGIAAGQGGFNLAVRGQTDLVGAAITGSDDAGANTLALDETHYHTGQSGGGNAQAIGTRDTLGIALNQGTMLAGQNITLAAGNNLTVNGGILAAREDLTLSAGHDLSLAAVTDTLNQSHDQTFQKASRMGLTVLSGDFNLMGKSIQSRTSTENVKQIALVSLLSADRVTLTAGEDLRIVGSQVGAQRDLQVSAGRDLTLTTAENRETAQSASETKESGMLGQWWQPSFGKTQMSADSKSVQIIQTGSRLSSVDGDMTLDAGRHYTQTGSVVAAQTGNIDVNAQSVVIDAAYEHSNAAQQTSYRQTAVGGSVSVPMLDTVRNLADLARAVENVNGARNQALGNAALAMNGYAAYRQAQALYSNTPGQTPALIKISANLGTSKSQSASTQQADTAVGSILQAGGNLTVAASGAGQDSNLVVRGSELTAGRNMTLSAENDLRLEAALNTLEQRGSGSASGASIGVGFSVGGSQNGFTLELSAFKSQGRQNGKEDVWTNSRTIAGETLTLQSGGDATLKGAVAGGNQVITDVGGNLAIESLRDQGQYESKQTSAGVSASICVPPFCAGTSMANVGGSKATLNDNYESVTEQSGIRSGGGGFQIDVKGDTALKGGLIASADAAIDEGRNQLRTGTLSVGDLTNQSSGTAENQGAALNTSFLTQGKYGVIKGIADNYLNRGEASGESAGTTRSAVSGGEIVITDADRQTALTGQTAEESIAALNRDTANAHQAAQRQDIGALSKTAQAQQAVRRGFVTGLTYFSDEAYRTLFKNGGKLYRIKPGCTDSTCATEVDPREIPDFEKASNGKVYVANNGIFNTADEAIQRAESQVPLMENGQKPEAFYLVYFPQADNLLSELMVSVYQKTLESDFFGLSQATQNSQEIIQQYGASGLAMTGHSRGGLTVANAVDAALNAAGGGSAPKLEVFLYGSATNAARLDWSVSQLQNRALTPEAPAVQSVVHQNDFVGKWIGMNWDVVGVTPEDSNSVKEFFRIFNEKQTAHSCYGTARDCGQYWEIPKKQP